MANIIRSFLHFSIPDEGPLTDYESWMPVSFSVTAAWLGKLTAYKQKEKISVDYFDTQTLVGFD